MDHWSETFDGDGVTADNRQAFVDAMSKYPTEQAGLVGGFNAMRLTGKPFKVPESMDKLPDDASRADFTSKAHKLLDINPKDLESPRDVESLKDFNFQSGMAEGAAVDENFVSMVKAWAVDSKVSTGQLEKMVTFFNGPLLKYAGDAQAAKDEADKTAAADACNTALVEHFKSEEKVKDLSTLMHRAIMGNMGLSAEEAGEFVDAMADTILTTNPVMARGMLNLLSSVAVEGTTELGAGTGGGVGDKQLSPYEYKKHRYPKSSDMWGDPSDKWDNESLAMRRLAKIK